MIAIGGNRTGSGGPTIGQRDFVEDFDSPYSYVSNASIGTAVSAAVWTITRIELNTDGTVTILTAVSVAWDDRLTATYT
jgi:hypothetical protein